jgi:hypothetical protein
MFDFLGWLHHFDPTQHGRQSTSWEDAALRYMLNVKIRNQGFTVVGEADRSANGPEFRSTDLGPK